MVKDVQDSFFTQITDNEEVKIYYKDLQIKDGVIALPIHNGQIEVLNFNNQIDSYSRMVADIFVKVASLAK
jgi:hypothetical protein